ncbi:MAG: preprotein translocase subunit YajC [Actinobacteria bacterium]|nr:preprotein translocase subunit YajC [Actinomycetota bacterium]
MNVLLANVIAQSSGGNSLTSILPLILLVPLFYWMFSQQKKQRRQQADLQSSIEVGDEIVTSGGIYGTVTFIEPDEPIMHVAIDTDVVIRITKTAVGRKVSADIPDATTSKSKKD